MNNDISGKSKPRISASAMILSIILGVILSLPFNVIKEEKVGSYPPESRQELASLLVKMQDEIELLETDLRLTRERASGLEDAMLEREETSAELSDTFMMYKILSGLEAVHGPGIKLTVSEDDDVDVRGYELTQYLIHQEDLLNIVNEMWLAGAEAIAIRGGSHTERLVMDSTIRCVGSLIDINNRRMTPPFDIFAIGDPDDLYSALTMPGGVLEPLAFFNIKAEIVKLDDIVLPSFSGSTHQEHILPLEESE